MIVGRWKSPNNSKDRNTNDSHEIKKQILKEVRRLSNQLGTKDYSKQVGDNPDIAITNGIIILKGRRKFKNRPYYTTTIPADDYFGLQFISTNIQGQFEVALLSFDIVESKNEILLEFENVYVIPNDEKIIELTFEKIFQEYLLTNDPRISIILVKK